MHTARNAAFPIVPSATSYRCATPTMLENLCIVPILGDSRTLDVLTLRHGMPEGVTISERRAGATVSRVSVVNRSNLPLLLLCGEHVVGCRQNRVFRRTLLVAPSDELEAPVLCVEQGRWHEQRSHVEPDWASVARTDDVSGAQATPVPAPTVLALHDGARLHYHPLAADELVLGRDPGCNIQIQNEGVSRRHAVLRRRADTWTLEDLGSTNGTMMGDDRVTDAIELRSGTLVRLGGSDGAALVLGTDDEQRRRVLFAILAAAVLGYHPRGSGLPCPAPVGRSSGRSTIVPGVDPCRREQNGPRSIRYERGETVEAHDDDTRPATGFASCNISATPSMRTSFLTRDSLRPSNGGDAQSALWSEVRRVERASGYASASHSYAELATRRTARAGDAVERLVWSPGQVGMALMHSHRILSLDVFANETLFAAYARTLIAGALSDDYEPVAPVEAYEREVLGALEACMAIVPRLGSDAQTLGLGDYVCGTDGTWSSARLAWDGGLVHLTGTRLAFAGGQGP